MQIVRAAGVLIVRGDPIESFLLMKHKDRLDLPKGHQDEGETDLECALREMEEETGVRREDVEIVPGFRWEIAYPVRSARAGGKQVEKHVVYFLARLLRPVEIRPTEHEGFAWLPWQPPHRLQQQTIDPLLAAVAAFLVS